MDSESGVAHIKETSFLSGILQAVFSNGFSTISQIFLILIVPRFITPTSYSYWQLYIFYISYVGILHFGWIDGMYLQLGGEKLENIKGDKLGNELCWFMIFQMIVSILFVFGTLLGKFNLPNTYVLIQTGIIIFVSNVRSFYFFLFQATNHIHEYSVGTLIEKVITVIMTIIFIVIGLGNLYFLIIADVLGKMVSLAYTAWVDRNTILSGIKIKTLPIANIRLNILRGGKLLVANFASLFMIGVVRYTIKRNFGIVDFGQISITLSISNFMVMLIQAISMVLFPYIRRIDFDVVKKLHSVMRYELSILFLWLVGIYYIVFPILHIWLPKYDLGLSLLWIIFPVIFFDGKFELLSSVYFQALNLEGILYKINLFSLLLSMIWSFANYLLSLPLSMYALTIIGTFFFRSFLGEVILLKTFHEKYNRNDLLFYIMITVFMLSNWLIGFNSVYTYIALLTLYTVVNRKNIFRYVIEIIKIFK
ncbi:lipopolysaccharide biosynthesis protein [Limosilactobacillus reuteri]|uniref:lipopolysaccharide biosynthesis protein n=1 Tax=Limosilactobacillus reuteri TaxID=1598 RepID=UPI003C93B5A3